MTMPLHWDHARRETAATNFRARQALMTMLKGVAIAIGLAAILSAIVAIRVYVFLPALH